jgi:predicted enzyme related to lactoylglutathione lyase
MREREGFPAGVPAWIDTRPADPDSAAEFYAGLVGWQFENRAPAGSPSYLVATLDGREVVAIGSRRAGDPASDAWTTYVAVDDADATAARVRELGGTVISDPSDLFDAARIAVCADPSGAVFGLWQPGTIRGAQVVNTPGSWNFSELNTGDVEGARRFYGALFGWEVDEVDLGGNAATMVRLPGYADVLEQFDPGIRQRHADFGAPPGFSECIAWIQAPDGDARPHWSVSFAVADADAVSARARELGGTVVVEPFDIAPVRSAVLCDPQGTQFTVNAFSPAEADFSGSGS